MKAIIVYPMNALANSQQHELTKFLKHGYPDGAEPITFRRYTGQDREAERTDILNNTPDILLTNYVMLELVLTRPEERDRLITAATPTISTTSATVTRWSGERSPRRGSI